MNIEQAEKLLAEVTKEHDALWKDCDALRKDYEAAKDKWWPVYTRKQELETFIKLGYEH